MKKFRLQMARRRGEKTASEYGFDSFPIDPFEICAENEITVEAKPPDRKGVSGGIFFHGNDVGIFYATNIRSPGFQRFTVGHELGHYFLEGHPEELQKHAPIHFSRAGFSQGDNSIEIEADHFSSGLLMPTKLVRTTLEIEQIGLQGIQLLAKDAICSLTASAIRAAECCPYPMAVIVSKGTNIYYGFLSESFKNLGKVAYPRKGAALPPSLTLEFNKDPNNISAGNNVCGKTSLNCWFGVNSGISLDEEVIGLGEYGYTLSVFSSETLPSEPDGFEDENENLIEAYTPRFGKRQRNPL